MYGYGYSPFIKSTSSSGGIPVDPDAQAFITAASITDPTQQSAINTLVTDLKGYGVWSKMKAVYPFVGGTASQHSYNLKNTAQYQITWNGGITHSSTGVAFNGTNGYGNTGLNQLSVLTQNSQHISFYSRTNTDGNFSEIGLKSAATSYTLLTIKISNAFIAPINEFYNFADNSANANGQGFYVGNRTAATVRNNWKNGSKVHTSSSTSQTQANLNFFIGALNNAGSVSAYTNKQCAFASIGDGLTDTEAANFYTAVQTFQVSLGRSIGTQTVSDADAQAFVTNAGIVDQVEADAVNNLVIGLKADGLWSKMKAIYPFVGGTASTHKFNLKNPLDTNAAFRLVFNGGWTHSSTGALPNGTNGFADTFLANNSLGQNNNHISAYSRTNNGILTTLISSWNTTFGVGIYPLASGFIYGNNNAAPSATVSNTDSRGFFLNSRTNNSQFLLQRNTTQNTVNNSSSTYITTSFKIGKTGEANAEWANREIAFISLGDGLTNSEAINLNSRVTTFNTTLNRQV